MACDCYRCDGHLGARAGGCRIGKQAPRSRRRKGEPKLEGTVRPGDRVLMEEVFQVTANHDQMEEHFMHHIEIADWFSGVTGTQGDRQSYRNASSDNRRIRSDV